MNYDGNEDESILKYAYFNSFFETGVKNTIDKAIIEYALDSKVKDTTNDYHKIDEIPFDYERRIMSVVIADAQDNHVLISKGALESVLAISTHVLDDERK
jgi:Mg2+-importing ATPase